MFFLISVCLVATLGGLLLGYDTAVISGTVNYLQTHFDLSEMMLGWVVSSAIVGCIIGAAVAGSISDAFGRKAAFFVAAAAFLISAVGTALPQTVGQLVFFRLIGGIGVGMACIISPMYIAEIAPQRLRGRLVSLNQIAILTGMVIVYIVNAQIAGTNTPEWNAEYGWRWMFGSGALPAAIFVLLIFTIPESPRWLIKVGRDAEARKVLGGIFSQEESERMIREVQEGLTMEEGGWSEVFSKTYQPALRLGVLLAIIQHGTGINAVMYYAPRIFSHAGVENSSAIGHMVIISLIMVGFTLVGLSLVDKLGRRPLLIFSTMGMSLSLFMLYFFYGNTGSGGFRESLVLFWIIAYAASFSIGMGPIVWVIISEIFPNRVRGRCASVAVFFMWTASLAISQLFPWLLKVANEGVFLIFAVLSTLSLIYIWLAVPETKGKSLEEIEQDWQTRASRKLALTSAAG